MTVITPSQRLLAYQVARLQGYKDEAVEQAYGEQIAEWIASKSDPDFACETLKSAMASPSRGGSPASLLTVAETLYTFAVKKPVPKTPPAPEPRMMKLGSRRPKGA